MLKEIIINGINVAECKHYFDNEINPDFNCANDTGDSIKCVLNENCDYKKLKRLEQSTKNYKNLEFENESLRVENARIKNESKKYRKALEEIKDIVKFAQSLPCTDAVCDCINCTDEVTNNGQFCMKKRIDDIKLKIKEVLK